MDLFSHDPDKIMAALNGGSRSDLHFACECADRIFEAVVKAGDDETLQQGFKAYRARNSYKEEYDSETGMTDLYPLSDNDLGAPPKEKTTLGRFNAPSRPVLYLSTTKEVALAEVKAISTDRCTVAAFKTTRPLRIAKLLQLSTPLNVFLSESPSEDEKLRLLRARTANFVSRRVQESDRELHYRACNLIASAFAENGFDGIAYRTSFWSSGWRDEKRKFDEDHIFASNLVLFDTEAAIPVWSKLFRINWKRPYAEEDGNGLWQRPTE